ncbi:hypothetical protein [Umezawaea tangerina]|uniref:hypothetical protein n=1 Tax=Umezawaea tangerina TaxID=84725 RepID=UPI001B806F59|nr:hypothetical protein [Umezawaea tangerina]
MRIVGVLGCLLVLGACGSEPEVGCTMIGTPVGIGLDVAMPEVRTATMQVCWDDKCVDPVVELHPSSSAGPQTCTGTAPTDSCGVSVVPTGGRNGFADVPDLPTAPVRVTLRLSDANGVVLVDEVLTATPKPAYPNGVECGGQGPQTGLVVSAAGVVTERT